MTDISTMCAAALGYAARGWTVFPIRHGTKRPHKSGEHSNGARWGASKHPAVIRHDHRRWPNANIGIPTGPDNGFFVVEADTKAGHDVDGIASLRALEADNGPLPETLMVESPSGSLHFYFKYPAGIIITNSASKIAPGVDVRGDGGMVVAPPSVKPGIGCYRWLNDLPIADAPAWLIDLILSAAKKSSHGSNKAPRVTTPKPARSGDPVERDKIQAALDVISSDCEYDQWYEIGAALHFEFGDAGFDLFDTWSAKSPQYDADECAAKWKGVAKVNSFTAATIFHYADQADRRWRDRYEETQRRRYYAELSAIFARAKGGAGCR